MKASSVRPSASRDVDRHFAELMMELAEEPSEELYLAAWLVSRENALGHSCLDIAVVAGRPLALDDELGSGQGPAMPKLEAWCRQLVRSGVVGAPGAPTPLILDAAHRLYLARYWRFEQELARDLLARAVEGASELRAEHVREALERLFPGDSSSVATDWQQVAAAVALSRKLAIVAGGPGTGKTYVVARTLALLLAENRESPPRIALCAPTGKAALRLGGSISSAIDALAVDDGIKDLMPREATTIHRLLRPRGRQGRFWHSRRRPLELDLLVVDECSMVDLPLMARVLAALPEPARLILLGDKDQLASVEAGSVFADICGGRDRTCLSAGLVRTLSSLVTTPLCSVTGEAAEPLADSIVVLTRGHRFGAASSIARLAQAVKENDQERLSELLDDSHVKGFSRHEVHTTSQRDRLRRELVGRYAKLLRGGFGERGAAELLDALSRTKVLCALRRGPHGVDEVNRWIVEGLRAEGVIAGNAEWYAGRPVLITRNDYALGLYNGDVGVVLHSPEGLLQVMFQRSTAEGHEGWMTVVPSRLPAHETAYAMTVHKSQGSEFDHVLLVLPPPDSPSLTRELLYTGITRARESVEIWGSVESILKAAGRPGRRRGGLRDKLWQPSPAQ